MGASANVPDLRKDRLLRFLPQSTREQACPRGSSSSAPFSRAGGRLVVVCDRRGHVRSARLSGGCRIGAFPFVIEIQAGECFGHNQSKLKAEESKVPQYMMLIYTPTEGGPSPEELQAMHPRWNAYTQSLSEAGVLVAGDALVFNDTATT